MDGQRADERGEKKRLFHLCLDVIRGLSSLRYTHALFLSLNPSSLAACTGASPVPGRRGGGGRGGGRGECPKQQQQ